MRWTVVLGANYDAVDFDTALRGFRRLYNAPPQRVLCAPDVLIRFASLHARSGEDALRRALFHAGLPVFSAVLPPGTIVFEGEVDENRMGDW
ncbi:MAG TPA: hypothetical protein VMA36_19525 [Candidatus Limnocylindria bacterium]|nr:hypothetical protein [Candidatus Limnocylindria bacterium]